MGGAPRLHDPLVRDQLDVAAGDQSSEQRKCSACFRVDLGRPASECSELFCIQKRIIDALRASLYIDILMQGCARLIGCGSPVSPVWSAAQLRRGARGQTA